MMMCKMVNGHDYDSEDDYDDGLSGEDDDDDHDDYSWEYYDEDDDDECGLSEVEEQVRGDISTNTNTSNL